MRVISQEGDIDVNYDNVTLSVCMDDYSGCYEILAVSLLSNNTYWELAEYTKKETVGKVLNDFRRKCDSGGTWYQFPRNKDVESL